MEATSRSQEMKTFCSNSQNYFQVRTPICTRSPYGCLETYLSAWGDTIQTLCATYPLKLSKLKRTYQRQLKQLDPEHGDPGNPRLGF